MVIRKEVMVFARAMEQKLRIHDDDWGKTGWKGKQAKENGGCSRKDLKDGLEMELAEFFSAEKKKDWYMVKDELPDVANFCMMLFDTTPKQED